MVIAFANQKGGTGKTTSLLTLADYLSSLGKRILIIDMDPQASATGFLLKHDENNENNLGFDEIPYRILIEGLGVEPRQIDESNIYLIPSSGLLARAELELALIPDSIDNSRVNRLRAIVDQKKEEYDYVFIDCPGSLGLLTMNGLSAADKVLIVSSVGRFERNSTKYFIREINNTVIGQYNPRLSILGIAITMTDPFKITDETLAALRKDDGIGSLLFRTGIPKNNAIRNATNESVSIFKYQPYSSSAKAYRDLWQEILERLHP